MPARYLVARELAELFKALAHPDRIRIVEELRSGERDVNALAIALKMTPARTSQYLAVLRLNRLVEERRDGRHHFYFLEQPDVAQWIVTGLTFIERRFNAIDPAQIASVRAIWSAPADPPTSDRTEETSSSPQKD